MRPHVTDNKAYEVEIVLKNFAYSRFFIIWFQTSSDHTFQPIVLSTNELILFIINEDEFKFFNRKDFLQSVEQVLSLIIKNEFKRFLLSQNFHISQGKGYVILTNNSKSKFPLNPLPFFSPPPYPLPFQLHQKKTSFTTNLLQQNI